MSRNDDDSSGVVHLLSALALAVCVASFARSNYPESSEQWNQNATVLSPKQWKAAGLDEILNMTVHGPILLEGFADSFGLSGWNRERLLHRCGEEQVPFLRMKRGEDRKTLKPGDGTWRIDKKTAVVQRRVVLRDFLQRAGDAESEDDLIFAGITEVCPNLLPSSAFESRPRWLSDWLEFNKRVHGRSLTSLIQVSIAGPGTAHAWHVHYETVNILLYGVKVWQFYPPLLGGGVSRATRQAVGTTFQTPLCKEWNKERKLDLVHPKPIEAFRFFDVVTCTPICCLADGLICEYDGFWRWCSGLVKGSYFRPTGAIASPTGKKCSALHSRPTRSTRIST